MFERNDQQRRANDAPFRGMFGPGGRSRPMPQARPDNVLRGGVGHPATEGSRDGDGG